MQQPRIPAPRPASVGLVAVVVALAVTAASRSSTAAGRSKAGRPRPEDHVVTDAFRPVAQADRDLKAVPFAPGAPAVVLLNVVQTEWSEDGYQRHVVHRRVKLLTPEGVASHGSARFELTGDWRVKRVLARTILKDGTVVDGADGVAERTVGRARALQVTFPRVAVGAIVDVVLEVATDSLAYGPWFIQEGIPVLETRRVLVPPAGLKLRPVGFLLPPEAPEPQWFTWRGRQAVSWTFRDVPALPDEPFQPPYQDVAWRIVFEIESFSVPGAHAAIGTTWEAVGAWAFERLREWSESGRVARHTAKEWAVASEDPRARAEAVLDRVRDEVAVDFASALPFAPSPDQVLAEKHGSSADVAGLAVAMLGAVGVDAQPALARPRSQGRVLGQVPVPSLFSDALVLVHLAGGDAWWSPSHGLPLGILPLDHRGTQALPIARAGAALVELPDVTAAENAVRREARLTLLPEGVLRGDVTLRWVGLAAHDARRELGGLEDAGRDGLVQRLLGDLAPTLTVEDPKVTGLDDARTDLVVEARVRLGGIATVEDGRIRFNPRIFSRVDPEPWSAESRAQVIDLGAPRDVRESVAVQLPEGVTDVTLPPGARMDAGPVGRYECGFEADGRTLRMERTVVLEQAAFPPSAWRPLRAWHLDMARTDAGEIVLTR